MGQLLHFIFLVHLYRGAVIALFDSARTVNQLVDGRDHEPQDDENDHHGGPQKQRQGQNRQIPLVAGDLLIHLLEGHHQVEGAQHLFIRGMHMAIAGTAGFVIDRADNAHHPVSFNGIKNADTFLQGHFRDRRIGVMADMAGFGLDIRRGIQFIGVIRELDLTGFVVNTDILNLVLPRNVIDNLLDVTPGIEHHGIVQAQSDGFAQPIHVAGQIGHELLFKIVDIEIAPGRQGKQKNRAHAEQDLGYQTVSQDGVHQGHGSSHLFLCQGPRHVGPCGQCLCTGRY